MTEDMRIRELERLQVEQRMAMRRQADRIRELEAERDQLRRIAVNTCNETDGWASEDASVGFLCGLPGEVAAIKRERDRLLEKLRLAHSYTAELATLKQIIESAHDGQTSIGEPTTHAAAMREIVEQRDLCQQNIETLRWALASARCAFDEPCAVEYERSHFRGLVSAKVLDEWGSLVSGQGFPAAGKESVTDEKSDR